MSTVQLVVDGVFIDLYEQDPIKLTYSIEDITNTETKSIFSRQFRVPATTHNFEFFKTAFEINGLDFDVTQKRDAQILDNGALITKGQLRLNKIFRSEKTGKIDYECFFLGETRSLGSAIGDKLVRDLPWEEYSHTLTEDTVIDSWQAYPQGALTDGIFDGDIIYPLANFGNTYGSDGVPLQTVIDGKAQGGGLHFDQNGQGLPARRFKPMVRAKVVWDKIFEEAGFTYSSEFINSDMFRKLYISAWGSEASINSNYESLGTFRARRSLGNYYEDGPLQLNQVQFGPGYNTTTYKYTVPGTINGITFPSLYPSGYNFLFTYQSSGLFSADEFTVGEIEISFKHFRIATGTTVVIDSANFDVNVGTDDWYFNGSNYVDVNPGDQLWIEVDFISGSQFRVDGGNFGATIAYEGVSMPSQLKDDYKQIDFVKDILTKFRLIMSPDKDKEDNFIIEPWKDYIATGDYYDWTKKVDLNKDFVIEPLFYSQTEEIDFMDKDDKDYYNELNINEFNEVFGTLKVDSQNELLKGKREIKTTQAPTPISQIDPGNQFPDGYLFIIPHIYVVEPGTDNQGHYARQNLPMNPTTRLLFYNGLKSTGGFTWYTREGVDQTAHTNYPMVSFYEQFPNNSGTLNLNWQKETGYIITFNDDPLLQPNDPLLGQSVYDRYWSQYIDNLYSKWSRRVTVYVEMSSEDLREFSFDDLIFIKDTYYYVEKIYDAPIGQDALVKVDLIKIMRPINVLAPIEPDDPTSVVWNTAPENYNEDDEFWQAK